MLKYINKIMAIKIDKKIKNLPAKPGVYLFKDKRGNIIYVGKSANLKYRVKSYFQKGAKFYSPAKVKMLSEIIDVETRTTDSEIEALVKESGLIKKLKPKFNVLMRDSKNYVFVGITRENYPRIIITHQPKQDTKTASYIGPFTDAGALRKTLRILRPIFPYYTKKQKPSRLEEQMGIVPTEDITKKEYSLNIRSIKNILKGKTKSVESILKKEINALSKEKAYEKAKVLYGRLLDLKTIMQHAHVLGVEAITPPIFKDVKPNFKLLGLSKDPKRIEAYDISNIRGDEAVGSMVVFEQKKDGTYKPNRSAYRKFKIKTVKGSNDTAMMREVLSRRLAHKDWPRPELIIIDGGKGQLNAALKALDDTRQKKRIPVISLAKRLEEVYFPKRKDPVLADKLGQETKRLLQEMRDETHRFGITFHRKLHRKSVLNKKS